MPDIFKILKDIEAKTVGVDPGNGKMQEGYFMSFRSVALPITKADYENPWDPFGGNLAHALDRALDHTPPAADPATAPKTGSAALDPQRIEEAEISRSMKTYLNTFMLTDNKLQMNGDYRVMDGSSKVSDSYWAVITGANGIPQQSTITPELQHAYDTAKAVLADQDDNITPKYQAYLDRQEKYHDKVKAYNRAYGNAITDPSRLQAFPRDGVVFQEDVDDAWDQWVGLGHKNEIENALDTLAAQGTDPAIALIARAKKRLVNSLVNFPNIGNIPYTFMSGDSWCDPDNDDGWTTYTSSEAHSESHFTASSTSFGGSAGITVGMWSVGGGFDDSTEKQHIEISANDIAISFSYRVVDVYRPGIDFSLFNLKEWFLMGDYPRECISKGTMAQELPADRTKEPVFLPSIVTSIVLFKDLQLSWTNWKDDWAQQESHIAAGGSVGFGPFCLSGRYKHGDQHRDFVADSAGETLNVDGIQLGGYASMILPASPQQNSADFLQHPHN